MDNSVFASKPRYEILDGLRGIAALTVVAFHLFEVYAGGDHCRQVINHGYLAVDFFFVLSGFVIGYAYDDRWAKGMGTWTFFKRRLVRLHPMVILGTFFGAVLFYFQGGAPAFARIGGVPWWQTLGVMLLCCMMIPLPPTLAFDIRGWTETNPLDGPAWSLQYEYFANILYALVVRHFRTWMLAAFVALSALLTVFLTLNIDVFGVLAGRTDLAGTVIGGWALNPQQLVIGFTRLLYPFFAGLLLSRLHAAIRVPRGGFGLCAAVVFGLLAMPYFAPAGMPWANGLYEAAVILFAFPLVVALGAGSSLGAGWEGRLCRFSGAISYPLYMIHYPLVYVQTAWVATHRDAPLGQHVFVFVSMFVLAVALAWAALRLYDQPVRGWLRGRKKQ